MAMAPERIGIGIKRQFTTAGVHPYDEVNWERRDARITNFRDGTVAFEQRDVEVPDFWSQNATNILAQKYFRGQLGTAERETSLKQVADRVADTIANWGIKDGYFVDEAEAEAFRDELKHLIIHQRAAFNSPVWFNIGVKDVPQQASACFILAVDDTMDAILDWYKEEGTIFKGGSGSGINLSKIRSSKEYLKGGGTASGPVSFMRGADASAGTIKCLEASTLLVTSAGRRAIADITPGDRVLTTFGLRPVESVHDNGIRPLVKVRTALGDEIRCTPEHRWWVRRSGGAEGWVEAADLRPGDFVRMDLVAPQETGRLQPLHGVAAGHSNEHVHDLPESLDEAFALWLGWVWGDGSITERPSAEFIAMQIGDRDPELVERYRQLSRVVFGSRVDVFANRHLDGRDASTSVRISSSQLIRFLELNGLRKGKAAELRVPGRVADSPAPVRAAFLSGLFEADGHMQNGYPMVSTISRGLAQDVHHLLASIGIPSMIKEIADRSKASGKHTVYTVRVVGCEGVRRFAKMVGFISERKHEALAAAVVGKSASPLESSWSLPHCSEELQRIWLGGDARIRRAVGPYVRHRQPRALSLLRARALVERFGDSFAGTAIERFADGDDFWVGVTASPDGEGPTFDITVEGVHQYLVNGLVTHNSGGKTRRAAKMVILNADHPDIEDFIWCKAIEERKARALRDAGFDMDLDGKDSHSIQYQNANNSVRVSDEFMEAVIDDADWHLRAVTSGEVLQTVKARDLFRQIAKAAWECADPGLQYDTTINTWHTAANTGRINGSNPCSEYVHLDNSACNLASINLLRFLNDDDTFDVEGYKAAIEVFFTAQEILVGNADYPTPKIDATTRRFRQLGLGYANLGALLMAIGLPYDSDGGRAYAAALTALMTGHAYATSARTAMRMGPFAGYAENRAHMNRVLRMHRDEVAKIDEELVPTNLLSAAQESWDTAVELSAIHGVRNSQATVLAPTGTISFLLDCDTTGIEPDLGLVKSKKLVGGGNMKIVNQTVPRALRQLGYAEEEVGVIVDYIDEHDSIVGAPLRAEDLPVFACSMGDNTIHYSGHIRMMGAVQPFISGAISKTVNVPEEVTVEDIEQLHIDAWRLGLKAVAIYRDNCKVAQPLSTSRKNDEVTSEPEAHDAELAVKVAELEAALERQTVVVKQPLRERLPRKRRSSTFKFRVADCEGYATVGEYDDGRPGEIFINVSKQGSTLAGIMDAFAVAVSVSLQHGVPLATYVRKYTNTRFEPAGMTDDPELRIASSLVDYIFRRLAVDYLPLEERVELGILTTGERMQPTLPGIEESTTPSSGVVETPALSEPERDQVVDLRPPSQTAAKDAPYCYQCGNAMQRAGSCFVCTSCGTTSGCS